MAAAPIGGGAPVTSELPAILVRLTAEEKRRVELAAREDARSMSSWVLMAIREKLARSDPRRRRSA
jgi:uncharacterized protein (DUF1778 family)